MEKEELTNKLDQINQKLNGVLGRLLLFAVPPRKIKEIAEAHEIALEVARELDDLINEII